MNHKSVLVIALALIVLALSGVARADTLSGVITSYQSGNQGTDMTVKTSDGRTHDLWFDNMKKPLFQGKPLPWCPSWPCNGWPNQLLLGKTRVTVTTFKQTVEGTPVETPTRVDLYHQIP
jgi:hypothetical protein